MHIRCTVHIRLRRTRFAMKTVSRRERNYWPCEMLSLSAWCAFPRTPFGGARVFPVPLFVRCAGVFPEAVPAPQGRRRRLAWCVISRRVVYHMTADSSPLNSVVIALHIRSSRDQCQWIISGIPRRRRTSSKIRLASRDVTCATTAPREHTMVVCVNCAHFYA